MGTIEFPVKLFHAEKCTGFTKITWKNSVSLHDISTFISAHETTMCCDYQMSMSVRLTLESMYCKPPQTQMMHFIVFFATNVQILCYYIQLCRNETQTLLCLPESSWNKYLLSHTDTPAESLLFIKKKCNSQKKFHMCLLSVSICLTVLIESRVQSKWLYQICCTESGIL